jgi:hypothetical protein
MCGCACRVSLRVNVDVCICVCLLGGDGCVCERCFPTAFNSLHCCGPLQDLLHSVVELGFTSSVRFLQSGLNIRGHTRHSSAEKARRPRQSWAMRKLQEQAALAEGLASWQVNPYFASGRVMVPASIDTFTCEVGRNSLTHH